MNDDEELQGEEDDAMVMEPPEVRESPFLVMAADVAGRSAASPTPSSVSRRARLPMIHKNLPRKSRESGRILTKKTRKKCCS